jgi:hypothetical protein
MTVIFIVGVAISAIFQSAEIVSFEPEFPRSDFYAMEAEICFLSLLVDS